MAIIHELKKEELQEYSKRRNESKRIKANIIFFLIVIILFLILFFINNAPIPYRDYIPESSSTTNSEQ